MRVMRRNHGRAQVDEQGCAPQPEANGWRNYGRGSPENRRDAKSSCIDRGETPSSLFATSTEVLDHEHYALHGISGSKAGGVPIRQALLCIGGHRSGCKDLNQREESVDNVIRVKTG